MLKMCVENLIEKTLGKPRRGWEDTIEIKYQGIRYEDMNYTALGSEYSPLTVFYVLR
jgi:hypothetical protein